MWFYFWQDCWRNFRFLSNFTKHFRFWQNFRFLAKFSFFWQNFPFVAKFSFFFGKIYIFGKFFDFFCEIFYFCQILRTISVFCGKTSDFWQSFRFLAKFIFLANFSIFGTIFDVQQNLVEQNYVSNLLFLCKILDFLRKLSFFGKQK